MSEEGACCPASEWVRVTDLGHTQGIDCALVRCSRCGRSWAHLWTPFAAKGGYAPLDEAAARELAALPAGAERKRRLRDLLDL